ncbi:unnamed protein product, partial [Closterium sp. NIES-53]
MGERWERGRPWCSQTWARASSCKRSGLLVMLPPTHCSILSHHPTTPLVSTPLLLLLTSRPPLFPTSNYPPQAYRKALEADPGCKEAQEQLAVAYRKALEADPGCKEAQEQLAVVLTDLGTRLKLGGSVQEGIAKYYEAIAADQRYA